MAAERPMKSEIRPTVRDRLAALRWSSIPIRTLLLAVGWWALTEGDRAGLAFGAPVVLLALLASVSFPMPRAPRWSLLGLLRLALLFLTGSVRAGFDIALRALAPRPRIDPAMIRYTLRLPAGAGRPLFVGLMNLMPGTVCAEFDGDELDIHVLIDEREALVEQLRALEARVARALGEPLEEPHA
ncbi:Na+/H+ antiporter subunit E [Sorangium sp. So ce1036]|uniref:Na+/H+ antiporter subunit E n=1 Tax=Sorangium sp. So ce1036 TaxID=3133328 RepID=UPI003EFE035D